MAWSFERVAGPFAGGLAGVAWDGRHVLFSAPGEARLLRFDPESGATEQVRNQIGRINGVAAGPGGELYGCQESSRRIIEFMPDGSARITATRLDGRLHNFPSDLAIDRDGRIWFADPFSATLATGPQLYPQLDHASVLRIARARNHTWFMQRLTFDTVAPQSVLLSADERTLFVAEGSGLRGDRHELRAYPIEPDGSLGTYTVLHTFSSDHRGVQRGIAGMCRDDMGNIVACAGSRRSGPGPLIYVVSPDGAVLETHPFPDDLPARCAFAGSDGGSLYVTTATGSLYRAEGAGTAARSARAFTK